MKYQERPPLLLAKNRRAPTKSIKGRSHRDESKNSLDLGCPHRCAAIGQELVHRGHRVLFTTCSLLVQELLLAKRELRLARLLKRFAKFRPLIIDDIGYVCCLSL